MQHHGYTLRSEFSCLFSAPIITLSWNGWFIRWISWFFFSLATNAESFPPWFHGHVLVMQLPSDIGFWKAISHLCRQDQKATARCVGWRCKSGITWCCLVAAFGVSNWFPNMLKPHKEVSFCTVGICKNQSLNSKLDLVYESCQTFKALRLLHSFCAAPRY